MVLFLQLNFVCVQLCSLLYDTPSGIVGEHGCLSVEIHGLVHFSHCDVEVNLKGGEGWEGEREGERG